ncbi:MAG TPA: hypothetical protein VFV11_00055 [Solimonas sp.]|nr:hypothetical protein [Solimonas sp.]
MKTALALGALLLASLPLQAFELVSPEEYNRDLEAPEVFAPPPGATRSLQPAWPKIEIRNPTGSEARPPVAIEVRFLGDGKSAIDPESFRVYYGMLGIDITDRIRKATPITAEGFSAQGAELPPGKHSLRMSLADRSGRRTEVQVKFKVLEPTAN